VHGSAIVFIRAEGFNTLPLGTGSFISTLETEGAKNGIEPSASKHVEILQYFCYGGCRQKTQAVLLGDI